MKMNWVEKFLMNNPIRAAFHVHVEAPLLERLGGRTEGLRVLEVGCGRGVGTEQIFRRFGAASVFAMDIDEDMVARARARLQGFPADRLRIEVGDVTAIDAEDASFDAVFDFAIIHHVPDWQAAVAEIRRVLKPGGRLVVSDIVLDGDLPAAVAQDVLAYVGCIAGAVRRQTYFALLAAAGLGRLTVHRDVDYLEAASCAVDPELKRILDENGVVSGALKGVVRSVTYGAVRL